jgi:hypothetical protein
MSGGHRERIDPARVTVRELVQVLFEPPAPPSWRHTRKDEAALARGLASRIDTSDSDAWVALVTRLFLDFGPVVSRHNDSQIEQVLWALKGEPFQINITMMRPDVSDATAVAFARSAFDMFAAYSRIRHLSYPIYALSAWWDEPWDGARPMLFDTVVETMIATLSLNDRGARQAALLGLSRVIKRDTRRGGHPAAVPAIEAFLREQGLRLSDEERTFALRCRDGALPLR